MVVIFLFATLDTGNVQDRTALPSIRMVHAPHCAMPHPYFVPTRLRWSRSTQSTGVFGSTSTTCFFPLMFRLIVAIEIEFKIDYNLGITSFIELRNSNNSLT